MEFKSIQEEVGSYRKAGFSYYQIADLMKISTKQVWQHLKKDEYRKLTGDELHDAINKVGLPRGKQELKPFIEIDRHLEASFVATLTLTNGKCPYCKEQVFPIHDFEMCVDIEAGKEHFKLHKTEYAEKVKELGL